MAKIKMFILIPVLGILASFTTMAQTRKELIEVLNSKADSLQKIIASKDGKVQELEIRLAKLQGAAETYDKVFKRLEDRSDSLLNSLNVKNKTIEDLNSELSKLNSELKQVQEVSARNEQLQTELTALKETVTPTEVGKKETKLLSNPKVASKPVTDLPAKVETEGSLKKETKSVDNVEQETKTPSSVVQPGSE